MIGSGVDRTASWGIRDALTRSRELGFLGPGPVDVHIEHAVGYASCVEAPTTALDLGSGGGVPGLALAASCWPSARWILLDAVQRRSRFLGEQVQRLGLADRVEVCHDRAEIAGRATTWRGQLDLVVARAFAAPAVTAECAAPFLRLGGYLVVSEPPGGRPQAWSAAGLALLGLEAVAPSGAPMLTYAVFRAVHPCPERYPRRVGIPDKRPLF